jgi:hypothetical protein
MVLLLALLPVGACQRDEATVRLTVTTPPASATAGGTVPARPTATQPASTQAPATPGPPPTAAAGPLAAYQALAADWQLARSRFFTAVSDGRARTPAEQRALAAAYLAGQRRLAAGLRGTEWPPAAAPAVRALLAVNAHQQAHVAAMARAPSAAAFTGRLADYGVGAARENAAVAAVARALGG